MTNEQKQRLHRQKMRKKRLLKKRVRAVSVLLIAILVIFLGVKAVIGAVEKNKNGALQNSTQQGGIDSILYEGQQPQNPSDTSEVQGADSTQSTEPPVEEVPVPQAEKPQGSWSTLLVNPTNPLPQDYSVEVRTISGTEKQYDIRAADSLEQMLADAEKAGCKMYLVSTYRTVAYQQGLFNRKINEYKNAGYDDETAYAEAAKWVAIPGTSEHNLGLAADIVSSTWYNSNSDLTEEFENTPHFKWLYEHCTDYGFILRYPKGKESVTGIVYEPWHYRYVGVEAAKYIMQQGITLEEFNA